MPGYRGRPAVYLGTANNLGSAALMQGHSTPPLATTLRAGSPAGQRKHKDKAWRNSGIFFSAP